MKNLAGVQKADTFICNELEEAGIEVVKVELSKGEVPYTFEGRLGDWVFDRRWYYWAARISAGFAEAGIITAVLIYFYSIIYYDVLLTIGSLFFMVMIVGNLFRNLCGLINTQNEKLKKDFMKHSSNSSDIDFPCGPLMLDFFAVLLGPTINKLYQIISGGKRILSNYYNSQYDRVLVYRTKPQLPEGSSSSG